MLDFDPRPPILPAPGPPDLGRSSGVGTLVVGAIVTVIVLVAVVGIGILGWHLLAGSHSPTDGRSITSNSTPASKSENVLADSSSWQQGDVAAKQFDDKEQSDIGWWTRTFTLPKNDAVLAYLKNEGLSVSNVVPVYYADTKDSTTITYQVHSQVPAELLSLQTIAWRPTNADQSRFACVLVINKGLQAGTMWDAQNPKVEAKAGEPMNFDLQVKLDKAADTVTTDRLPLGNGVFTQPQVQGFQSEAANTVNQLQGHIDAIDAQVKNDAQVKLAQVPADLAKPQLVSTHWNHGDGSGEPTKSAERIGGGTAAGAAGGAAFGAAAGDAGMGAGIGAGVGLLGGIIYDTVSKNNDREKYERRARAENDERISEWKGQCRQLAKQRDQIKLDATAERKQMLDDLAKQVASNGGRFDGLSLPSSPEAIGNADAPNAQPTADQPSGPIQPVADSGAAQGGPSTDAALSAKLIGYWKSPRHAYHYAKDGTVAMVGSDNPSSKSSWQINGKIYSEQGDDGRYSYDILTLTDSKFVYRSRDASPTTFMLSRISRKEAEDF